MNCIACGTEFHCGAHDSTPCWCSVDAKPSLPVPLDAKTGCYCPPCLAARVIAATAAEQKKPT